MVKKVLAVLANGCIVKDLHHVLASSVFFYKPTPPKILNNSEATAHHTKSTMNKKLIDEKSSSFDL